MEGTSSHRVDELPPLDSQALAFDISRETRRTVVDLIRGGEPTTILGLLLASTTHGVTVETIAERLDYSVGLVNWNIEKLEREDLCVRVEMDESIKILPLAAYSERNA
jgi:DNA-binding MarR family transcriptional regulator